MMSRIQHCSISKVAFDLFTDILSAVGLLSTGNRKHIITTVFMNFYIDTLHHCKTMQTHNHWC